MLRRGETVTLRYALLSLLGNRGGPNLGGIPSAKPFNGAIGRELTWVIGRLPYRTSVGVHWYTKLQQCAPMPVKAECERLRMLGDGCGLQKYVRITKLCATSLAISIYVAEFCPRGRY